MRTLSRCNHLPMPEHGMLAAPKWRLRRLWLAFVLLAVGATASQAQTINGPLCRVNQVATGTGDGSSWANAIPSLRLALDAPGCSEIWVAQGVYKPIHPANPLQVTVTERQARFNVRPGVAVHGGFAATESSRSQRVPGHSTVLSGDIDGNDVVNSDGVTERWSDAQGSNSYNVVTLTPPSGGQVKEVLLEGLIISAAMSDNFDQSGSGVRTVVDDDQHARIRLSKLHMAGNQSVHGAGLFVSSRQVLGGVGANNQIDLVINDSTFSHNNSTGRGGGFSLEGVGGTLNPDLSNVTFADNSSEDGAGMFVLLVNPGVKARVNIKHATFSNNLASKSGGALYLRHNSTNFPFDISITDSVFWGNRASAGASILEHQATSLSLGHSLVENASSGLSTTVLDPFAAGVGNLQTDPLLGSLADHGGFVPTLRPGPTSPVIDTANLDTCLPTDQRGLARPIGAGCDMGAVELQRYTVTFNNWNGDPLGSQTVVEGGGATAPNVPARPGYTLTGWNPPNFSSVTSDLLVTAQHTINQYSISYSAGTGGSLTGNASQSVDYGQDGSTITAVAYAGYHFTQWSDGVTANPRTDTNVQASISVEAEFDAENQQGLIIPEGPYDGQPLQVDGPAASDWVLTHAETATTASLGTPPPAGVTLPHGVVSLTLEYGAAGTGTSVVLTYPQGALQPGMKYYKFGATLSEPAPHWYVFPGAQFDFGASTITLSFTDNADGDDRYTTDSLIQDPGGPGVPQAVTTTVTPVPTLGEWGLLLTSALLALGAAASVRGRKADCRLG